MGLKSMYYIELRRKITVTYTNENFPPLTPCSLMKRIPMLKLLIQSSTREMEVDYDDSSVILTIYIYHSHHGLHDFTDSPFKV